MESNCYLTTLCITEWWRLVIYSWLLWVAARSDRVIAGDDPADSRHARSLVCLPWLHWHLSVIEHRTTSHCLCWGGRGVLMVMWRFLHFWSATFYADGLGVEGSAYFNAAFRINAVSVAVLHLMKLRFVFLFTVAL